MKQPIRLFAIGLITAGIVILIIFFFQDTNKARLSTDEMIDVLEDEGYHVLNNSDYISLSVKNDKQNSENGDTSKTDKDENDKDVGTEDEVEDGDEESVKDEESDDKISYTLKIESGDTPDIIANTLYDEKIIKDVDGFLKYLDDNGYSQSVQIGEFNLNSEMSTSEIAKELTK